MEPAQWREAKSTRGEKSFRSTNFGDGYVVASPSRRQTAWATDRSGQLCPALPLHAERLDPAIRSGPAGRGQEAAMTAAGSLGGALERPTEAWGLSGPTSSGRFRVGMVVRKKPRQQLFPQGLQVLLFGGESVPFP
jgi:hypothetical protein